MDGRSLHLADQIKAAYQDTSKNSLEPFDELTSQASTELSLDEWKELCEMLGYDVDTDTWVS
jgi:hypothetical protein